MSRSVRSAQVRKVLIRAETWARSADGNSLTISEMASSRSRLSRTPTARSYDRFAAAWRIAKRFRHSRSDWAQLVDATFRGLTTLPPSRTFFEALYARFARAGAWRVFDDVPPTLEALASRGLKLAVISNWDERLRPLLTLLTATAGRLPYDMEPYFPVPLGQYHLGLYALSGTLEMLSGAPALSTVRRASRCCPCSAWR